jgi:NaMN:DMB phosphoribosyltransferase
MQPVVAGMALAASKYLPVVLAGGTQMAAVLALAAALYRAEGDTLTGLDFAGVNFENIALVTTGWVANDPSSDLAGLAAEIEERFGPLGSAYLAANLNFADSAVPAMRLYEAGFVKEGVGAGAAAFATMLAANLSAQEFLPAIEAAYRKLVED